MKDSGPRQNPGLFDGVPDEWLDAHLATVFSRAHRSLFAFHAETTDRVISAAGILPGFRVLDVGCGAGVPALTVAERVGPEGGVVATDPSPIFLEAIAANAQERGLTNMEFVQCSASGLPFEHDSFDAATCHMGVMFFEDVHAGLIRMREILRPGGKAGFVAWGPEEDNPFFGTLGRIASRYVQQSEQTATQPLVVDAPRPTRFAEPGTLSGALQDAGYRHIAEDAPVVDLVWPGTTGTLITFWLELTRIDERIPAARLGAFKDDLREALTSFAIDGGVRFPVRVVVGTGEA